MSASQATSKVAATPASPLTARIAAEFAVAHAGGKPVRGDAKRQGGTAQAAEALATRSHVALQALMDSGLPTSRDENWKYVNLRPLEKVRFVPPPGVGRPAMTAADLPAAVGKSRYVFVDGVFEAGLSTPITQAGVTVTSMKATGVAAANDAA